MGRGQDTAYCPAKGEKAPQSENGEVGTAGPGAQDALDHSEESGCICKQMGNQAGISVGPISDAAGDSVNREVGAGPGGGSWRGRSGPAAPAETGPLALGQAVEAGPQGLPRGRCGHPESRGLQRLWFELLGR